MARQHHRAVRFLGFTLLNFAAPIAFFAMFQIYGAKPAIALAVTVTSLQALAHWVLRIRASPFFLVASAFTLLFGGMDLILAEPRFYRFSPALQNFTVATGLLGTLLGHVPMVEWFANALPPAIRPETKTPEGHDYLRKLSWVWVGYLYGKAVFFLWLAFRVDLGRLILLRALVGGITLWGLVLGEIYYRTRIRPRRRRA